MKTPIIFIHYGDRDYLKPIFEVAVSKGNDVILIGDQSNFHYSNLGISHYQFDDFLYGSEIDEFNKNYKFVHGKEFRGSEFWVRFNFLKVWVLYNFMVDQGLNHCWLFDSDVIVNDNLDKYISLYKHLDYTSQPGGHYMPQGYIGNVAILKSWFLHSMQKFQDQKFINSAINEFKVNPIQGLTYMRFWKNFIENNPNINQEEYVRHLKNNVLESTLYNNNRLYQYRISISHMPLSTVFFGREKKVFVRGPGKGQLLEASILNVSWLPQYLIERICNHILGKDLFSFTLERLWFRNKLPIRMHLAESRWQQIFNKLL